MPRGRPRKKPVEPPVEATSPLEVVLSPAATVGKKKPKRVLTAREEVELIRKARKHFPFSPEPSNAMWFKHPDPGVRRVFGSEEFGLRFGRIFSVSGAESHGKTSLIADMIGEFQKQGIPVGLVDFENSFDDDWYRRRGADPEQIALFDYQTVSHKKISDYDSVRQEDLHILTAEELLDEADAWTYRKYVEDKTRGIVLVMDSVAAIMSEAELDAGLDDRRTTMLAAFMSKALRRWQSLCASRNIMLILVNQLREKPNTMWGDPVYEPGGRAMRHYPSIMVRVRRIMGKKGALTKDGKEIGIKGVITNRKNKSGGGSQEHQSIGFKLYYRRPTKFVPVSEVEKTQE